MHALLVALTVVAAEPEENVVYNARSLVTRDWSAVTTVEVPNGYRGLRREGMNVVLSLREGDRWDSGKAWLFRTSASGASAFKGHYTVYHDADDEDNLVLELRMTRKYVARTGPDGRTWDLENGWEPVGVQLDLPIAFRTVPARLPLTSRRAFFVDEKGDRVTKYQRTSGFFDTLRNGGKERRPSFVEFFPVGNTLQFDGTGAPAVLKALGALPPGYSARAESPW